MTNAITHNDVNVPEAMFIIKSTITNIFFPTSGIESRTPVMRISLTVYGSKFCHLPKRIKKMMLHIERFFLLLKF